MPLAPATSSVARKALKTAYEALEDAIIPADKGCFQQVSLNDVRNAAVDLEQELAARQSLRNMRRLVPLFDGMEHFARALGPLCAGTRYQQGIWAPISSILRAASEHIEALEQIIKGYSELAQSLRRFELLRDAFKGNSGFQESLALLYSDILQFHKYTYTFVHRSGWKDLFATSWGRFQLRLRVILEDMNKHQALIDFEANACNINEAREFRAKSQDRLQREERESAAKNFQAVVSALKIDESDQLSILENSSSEGLKHPGTCSWTIKNPKVRSWLQPSPDTPVLWLQGQPGTGKSVISARLVDYLRNAQWPVVSHFCSFSYSTSIQYEQILRSLILQLLRMDDYLAAHAYHIFVQLKKAPSLSLLERVLQTFVRSASQDSGHGSHVWIVLDGIDECDPRKQDRLASLINQITSTSSQLSSGGVTCKVLVSSRHSLAFSNRLKKKQTLALSEESEHINEAIKLYASQRLQGLHTRLGQLGLRHEDADQVACSVVEKAAGMFLYARLVMDYIATNVFYNFDEIRSSVNELPQEIFDFYQRILNQMLRNQDSRSYSRIQCLLGWIAFSKRPLKRLELLSAVTFSEEGSHPSNLAPRYILDEICGPIVFERSDTTMAFIHASVKEFLRQHSMAMTVQETLALEPHCKASIRCLLNGLLVFHPSFDEHTRHIRTVKGIHGFHLYASEYWTEYILAIAQQQQAFGDDVIELATQLVKQLHYTTPEPALQGPAPSAWDDRLRHLEMYPALRHGVEQALLSRSLSNLESQLLSRASPGEEGAFTPREKCLSPDILSATLNRYQDTLKFLLERHDIPGISAQELDLFKEQFRMSTFTCRLATCPHATDGFLSKEELHEHEMAHARGYRCASPGCQFYPFPSKRALLAHRASHHSPLPARKTIRRAGHDQSPMTIATASYDMEEQQGYPTVLTSWDHDDQGAQPETTSLPEALTAPSTPNQSSTATTEISARSPASCPDRIDDSEAAEAQREASFVVDKQAPGLEGHDWRLGNDAWQDLSISLVAELDTPLKVLFLCISLNGHYLALGLEGKTTEIYHLAANPHQLVEEWSPSVKTRSTSVSNAFSADGSRFLSGLWDGAIQSLPVVNSAGEKAVEVPGLDGFLPEPDLEHPIAVSAENHIASAWNCAMIGLIRMVNKTGETSHIGWFSSCQATSLAFSSDSSLLAAMEEDGSLSLWKLGCTSSQHHLIYRTHLRDPGPWRVGLWPRHKGCDWLCVSRNGEYSKLGSVESGSGKLDKFVAMPTDRVAMVSGGIFLYADGNHVRCSDLKGGLSRSALLTPYLVMAGDICFEASTRGNKMVTVLNGGKLRTWAFSRIEPGLL